MGQIVRAEDGEKIQSPKRCVLKYKHDGILNIKRTLGIVQKHNICTNVPSSQLLDLTDNEPLCKPEINEITIFWDVTQFSLEDGGSSVLHFITSQKIVVNVNREFTHNS
jgi:hypothetical protein